MNERINSIDAPGHNGLDGVYIKDGEYYIVEAKYSGSASLNPANEETGLARQMSDQWIATRDWTGVNLDFDTILELKESKNYTRLLAKVDEQGNVTYKYVSDTGYLNQGGGPLGTFIP